MGECRAFSRSCAPVIDVSKPAGACRTKISFVFHRGKRQNLAAVPRRCECYDLYDHLVPYTEAWRWQKELAAQYADDLIEGKQETSDKVILLQHQPVYTLGTASSSQYLRFDRNNPPCELHVTERGGEVTYHGPGQLVLYPILNYRAHGADLHAYLRSLEEVVIQALRTGFLLDTTRISGLTGVWARDQKLAAIGVRVARGVTYHGLALNVTTDLAPFEQIVPCGIADKAVGSVCKLLHMEEPSDELLDIARKCLLHAFAEVFNVELVPPQQAIPFQSPNQFQYNL